jgi:hypothetical protein
LFKGISYYGDPLPTSNANLSLANITKPFYALNAEILRPIKGITFLKEIQVFAYEEGDIELWVTNSSSLYFTKIKLILKFDNQDG